MFFGPSIFVNGRAAAVRAEAATVNSLGPMLRDELVKTVAEHELTVSLEDELLETTLCEASEVTDNGAAATRVAKLLARIASALPRA